VFTKWIVRLRALFRRDDVEAEFDEELRFHLDQETERYVGRGLSPEDARRAARRDLGDTGRVKEEARETWRWRWVDDLLLDVRYARRGLVRSAGYTVVAALSLGFGIGATTSLFSVIDALDLRPLPYRDADRMVWLADVTPSDHPSCPGCPFSTSPSTAALWSEQARSYDAFALWSTSDVYFGQGDVADYVSVGYASAGFFELLGVTPLLGRGIGVEDTASGADPIVLLSYESWQSRFGGDRSVLGERIEFYSDPGEPMAPSPTITCLRRTSSKDCTEPVPVGSVVVSEALIDPVAAVSIAWRPQSKTPRPVKECPWPPERRRKPARTTFPSVAQSIS
jgi:hypothetical protein